MKFMKYKHWILAGTLLASVSILNAGNEDRAGSAGSMDLLINPWARSSGWFGANTAIARGLEAQFLNVAGMAFTQRTELIFSHTRWLAGTDIGINNFGFSQNLGKKRGVIGLSVTSLGSGAIEETTVNSPEGTGNTYSVNNLNIAVSYARSFSDKIYGGVTVRIMSQSLTNISATGFTIDAGIMYKTTIGKRELNKDNLHFGITLKNIGPRMMASGEGLTVYNISPINGAVMTQQQRSADFEVPALMNIGAAYVQRFTKKHAMTFAFNFTSHSFSRDQFLLGIEYNFNDMLMLRGGYAFEDGIFGERDGINPDLLNAFTGPSGGLSFEAPFKKNKPAKIAIDYSFRATYNFAGVHTFGARLLL